MSRFTNKTCPVCRSKFTDDSDVVVCPECGTPHHRVCYLSKGHCAVEEHHAEGYVWNGLLPDEQPETTGPDSQPDAQTVPQDQQAVQTHPRQDLSGMDQIQDPEEYIRRFEQLTTDDVRGEDGVSLHELCAFASKSVFHYWRAFTVFRGELNGKKTKVFMNLCAGLFSPMHQFYRKMDSFGMVTTLLSIALMLPGLLELGGIIVVNESNLQMFSAVSRWCSMLGYILTVMLCLFGDYFYYRHAVKKIKKIRARFGDGGTEEYYQALSDSGKPSMLRAIVGMLIWLLISACICYLPRTLM